jgi:hypothetical protein
MVGRKMAGYGDDPLLRGVASAETGLGVERCGMVLRAPPAGYAVPSVTECMHLHRAVWIETHPEEGPLWGEA